jgi:hypothetical protein
MMGDTTARLFTEQEIEQLKDVVDLIDSGVSVQEAFSRIDEKVREIRTRN